MKTNLETERLTLSRLGLHDAHFIFELVNSAGWLQFIGDRKVTDLEQAKNYIQRIDANPNIKYWTVRLKSGSVPIGIITLIKREYLDNHDIGFAFLPRYAKKGYAYEAAKIILDMAFEIYPTLLATTVQDNKSSIQLLVKLGLQFEKTIEVDNINLLLYAASRKQTVSS